MLQEHPFVTVSPKVPRYFEADGKYWIPIGCNICFDRLNYQDELIRENYNRWICRFAENGGNCLRLWAGHSSMEIMPAKPGVFDDEKEKTMLGIIRLCERLGIKVKITLESFRMCFSEEKVKTAKNPSGINFNYVATFNRPLYAPYASDMKAFFQSSQCREIYLMKARRFKELGFGDSPAVFCWELWNEINSTEQTCVYADWSDFMLAELKAMFPRQLVVQNLGSFSDVASYQSYDQMATVKDNDFMQIHRYLDAGACLDVCRGPMDVLVAEATREMLHRRADCPAIVAETGAVQANHAGPFPYYSSDKEGTLLHDALFAAFFSGSAGCSQFWHWDHQYIDGNNIWWQFARFAKAIEGLDPIAEEFKPFYTESRRLRMYGLRGRKTTAVWCRDKSSDWRSEFVDGNKPELLSNQNIPFNDCELECYLPWKDRTMTTTAPLLPPFRRSIVFRVPSNALDGLVRPH